MKKIAVTLGLATAGAAGVHAAYAPDASDNKDWSVSALFRGVYNDNPGAVGGSAQGSYGYQISPQFQIVKPYNQTELGLRYIYTLLYYSNQDVNGLDPYQQTHWVNLWLDHVFNERWEVKVSDSILATEDPQLGVNGTDSSPTSDPFRNGNYVNNIGTVAVHTDWTREFGTVVTYQNNLTSYDEGGAQITNGIVTPSYAGQFNDMDQSATLDLQWHASSETIYGVGYTYDWVNYTAGEPIALFTYAPGGTNVLYSDYRNNYSHTAYLSYQHNLSDTFRFTAQAGAQIQNEYNQPLGESVYPYFNLTATYNYGPGSYVSMGFSQSVNTSYLPQLGNYVINTNNGTVTAYQESSTVFATLNHQITPKLVGLLTGRYQHGDFQGGPYGNQSDDYYTVSANLNYAIAPHFSVEVGYTYSQVESVAQSLSYTTDSYEIGLTASY